MRLVIDSPIIEALREPYLVVPVALRPALEFGHFSALSDGTGPTDVAISPEGRFESSPAFQGWDPVEVNSSPGGTAEGQRLPCDSFYKFDLAPPQQFYAEEAVETPSDLPSLRDLGSLNFDPSLERLGYSQISLREKQAIRFNAVGNLIEMSKLQCRSRCDRQTPRSARRSTFRARHAGSGFSHMRPMRWLSGSRRNAIQRS
jgi:hypothetical protein